MALFQIVSKHDYSEIMYKFSLNFREGSLGVVNNQLDVAGDLDSNQNPEIFL